MQTAFPNKELKARAVPYIAAAIAVPLWLPSATAKPVDLMCMVPQTSMYFTVTFDEETGRVSFEGLPTIRIRSFLQCLDVTILMGM